VITGWVGIYLKGNVGNGSNDLLAEMGFNLMLLLIE
jgi:hypothetical protein